MTPPRSAKEMAGAVARLALRGFLDAGGGLDLTPTGRPVVSVLMLTCNRAEVTLPCLQSLAAGLNRTPFEVVVVDNASTDETHALLDRVRGLTVVRNPRNVGYPIAVNQAAAAARGDYFLLLNNDTEVLGDSIDAAAGYLAAHPDAGAVGGRVVLLDGTLQEAGIVVWRDGWVDLHGRGHDPDDPGFGFARDVDHVSGAFLMTPRAVFAELGGLDEGFSPGYFEDVDFTVRLRRTGRRVVYLPGVTILHYENATHGRLVDVSAVANRHHDIFAARHADWLRSQPVRRPERLDTAPFRRTADEAAQVFALAGPEVGVGQLVALAGRVERAAGFVTLGLLTRPGDEARQLAAALPTTEVIPLADGPAVREFLAGRAGRFDLGLVLGDADPTPLGSLRAWRWDGTRAVPLPRE